MSAQELKTIRGYVQALPASSGGEEAARVAVITEDGAAYHILHKGAGAPLVCDINANVEITGEVRERTAEEEDGPGGCFAVTVKSYRLTDGFDDPWYDDDDH